MECLNKELSMDMELIFGRIKEISIMEVLKMGCYMDMVYLNGLMAESMREIGLRIKCMERVFMIGLMERSI
jgi:hypothetical protein